MEDDLIITMHNSSFKRGVDIQHRKLTLLLFDCLYIGKNSTDRYWKYWFPRHNNMHVSASKSKSSDP